MKRKRVAMKDLRSPKRPKTRIELAVVDHEVRCADCGVRIYAKGFAYSLPDGKFRCPKCYRG